MVSMIYLTYIGPSNDNCALNTVDVCNYVLASHHFLLRLRTKEYVDPTSSSKTLKRDVWLRLCENLITVHFFSFELEQKWVSRLTLLRREGGACFTPKILRNEIQVVSHVGLALSTGEDKLSFSFFILSGHYCCCMIGRVALLEVSWTASTLSIR